MLILSTYQTALAAEDLQDDFINLAGTHNNSETFIDIEESDPAGDVKKIIVDVKRWSEPFNSENISDCETVDPRINEKTIIESTVDKKKYKSLSRKCLDEREENEYVVSDAAHIFALDPFDIGEVTRHATIENIIKNFGVPHKIEIGEETQLQFSRYIPVGYFYPGIEFTFGYESHWIPVPGSSQVTYEPYEVLDKVQGISITSPDVNLRDGMHVGMKWDEVVEKLGKPYDEYAYYSSDSHTFRSNTIYYDITKPFNDIVEFEFRVDEKNIVTKIVWPRYAPD